MTVACTKVVARLMKSAQIPAVFKIQPSGCADRLNAAYVLEQDSRIILQYFDLSN